MEEAIRPIIACLILEVKKQHFQTVYFGSPELLGETICEQENVEILLFGNSEFVFQHPAKKTDDKNDKFYDRRHLDSDTPERSLLKYLMRPENNNVTLICGSSLDLSFIVRAALDLNISQRDDKDRYVISQGRKISYFRLPIFGLTFLNSELYFDADILKLNEMYSILPTDELLAFPSQWCHRRYYNYTGKFPVYQDFEAAGQTEKEIKLNMDFEEKNRSQEDFNFKTALKIYAKQQTYILLKACLIFIDDCFNIQVFLRELGRFPNPTVCTPDTLNFLFPFSQKIISRTGFFFNVFLAYCMDTPIYLIKKESSKGRPSSLGEIAWITLRMHKFPMEQHHNAITLGSQYYSSPRAGVPDSFCLTTQTAFFYNGCKYHGYNFFSKTIYEKLTLITFSVICGVMGASPRRFI